VMRVWFDAPGFPSVMVSRFRKAHGEMFSAHKLVPKGDGTDQYLNNVDVKANSGQVKLRLMRAGGRLQFLVAEEGQSFRTIQTVEIGTGDATVLQVNCNTMYSPIALDVRLTELDIRADQIQIPKQSANADLVSSPPDKGESNADLVSTPSEKGESKVWLVIELLGLGVVLSLVVASGLWLYRRHSRRAEQTQSLNAGAGGTKPEAILPPISFSCSACGKALKAKAGLAGKKVKCSQCGTAVLVPATEADRDRVSS
jgi:hypothetical protein